MTIMVLFILVLFIPVLSNTFLDENKQEKENEMAKNFNYRCKPIS